MGDFAKGLCCIENVFSLRLFNIKKAKTSDLNFVVAILADTLTPTSIVLVNEGRITLGG